MKKIITPIYIIGASYIVPKARPRTPRSGKGRVCLPKNYIRSQKQLSSIFKALEYNFIDVNGCSKYPFDYPISLTFSYTQNRGDADNIGGAILDAMVKSGMIKDDSKKYVPDATFQWFDSLDIIHPGATWVLEIRKDADKDRLDALQSRLSEATQL